ncbi:MAG TPA: hypothetical protein VMI54_30810 [Polyangiaceae bacterium]|nr:hypothetical protein [Polyangiaceae bacterium]
MAALIVDAGVLGAGIVALTLLSRALNVRFEAPGDRTRALLRLRYSVLLGAQVAGATSGIVVVHVLLKWSGLVALQWMSECPRQLVNDAVATFGTLAAVWACAPKQLRLDVLVATLAALLVYGMTRSAWHVDRPPVTFVASIQELVVGLVIAVATGLLAFRRFSPQ